MVQRIGQAGQDELVKAIAVIMPEKAFLLLEKTTDNMAKFADLHSPVLRETEDETRRIMRELYFDRLATKRVKSKTLHGRIDSALLWLLNTTSCRARLIMANFVDRDAFSRERLDHCCDNCVYS